MSSEPFVSAGGASSVCETAVAITTLWDGPEQVDAQTQLLAGEPVRVLAERGGWSRVVALWQPCRKHPDGYPGWVPSSDLAAPVERTLGPSAYVTVPATTSGLLLGTVLWAEPPRPGTADVAVLLPGGGHQNLDVADVRLSTKAAPPSYDPGEPLSVARRLLGAPYRWGGTSVRGVDCSGLVHVAWRTLGVRLPRDAADQLASPRVQPVPLHWVQPGDLLFFARDGRPAHHVGIATDPPGADGLPRMLHAPQSGAVVIEEPLGRDRAATLVAAGRVHAA